MSESQKTYVPNPGYGALFAHADKDSGEIKRISGQWVTPEGLLIKLDGRPEESGAITFIGSVDGAKGLRISGFLNPKTYEDDTGHDSYKMGEIVVAGRAKTMKYIINSKIKMDRDGVPYRFIWTTNNTHRVAF